MGKGLLNETGEFKSLDGRIVRLIRLIKAGKIPVCTCYKEGFSGLPNFYKSTFKFNQGFSEY